MSRRAAILLVLGLAVAAAWAVHAWRAPRMAPQAAFTTLEHGVVPPAALHGKVVLVNFWATSCEVCLKEMPRLAELQRKYESRGFDTIAVAMPYDPPNLVVAYQQRAKLPFKVAIDPNGEVARRFDDVKLTPTTYLIDRRGRVLRRYVGEPDFGELERLVDAALAG